MGGKWKQQQQACDAEESGENPLAVIASELKSTPKQEQDVSFVNPNIAAHFILLGKVRVQ